MSEMGVGISGGGYVTHLILMWSWLSILAAI